MTFVPCWWMDFLEMKNSDRPSKVKIWILAARPKTLWAAVAPVVIGTAMAFERGYGAWLAAAAALFGAMMVQIGTNFSNDYFDYQKGADAGDRLGPMRVTQAGLVKPETMKGAFIVAFALAMFTNLKFVHPVRTERWRALTLPVALAWTWFAGWAAWVDFHPETWAHWGLIATSLYLVFAGVAQQIVPERTRAG